MSVIVLLTFSVLLQLTAAVLALRLTRITGAKLAWLALAGAIFLMALRRAMTLASVLSSYPERLPDFQTEFVALIISALVLFAVIMIKPLFESIRRSERELFTEKERVHVTLQSIGDGVISFDTDCRLQYMNPMAEQLLGVSLEKAEGKLAEDVVMFVDENTRKPLPDPVHHCINSHTDFKLDNKTVLINQSSKVEHAVEVMASPIEDSDGTVIGTVMVIHDITELKGMARQLSYQATHDSLTGLINRNTFEHKLERLLELTRHSDDEHAMCYLDMDDFKIVNDTCGHIAGDEMLKSITGLLKRHIRETDVLARLGGDEFGILFESCQTVQVSQVVEKLRQAVSEYSFAWQDNVFRASISIGVVPINRNSGSITDVLSAADSACYVAKERGRNCVHIFAEDDTALARRHGQMQWVPRIQRALAEDRFTLNYQLIRPLDNPGSSPDFAEVLLRMYNEEGQLICPASFIPAAERYHLMPEIDRWVIRKIFRYIEGVDDDNDRISMYSINLSGQSLGEESFIDFVIQQFEETGIPSGRVCFEITETAMISNIVYARRFIEEMRERGCHFALDDFGSGLSSFSYLKSLPVDYLKIDGNFVQGILTDQNDFNLVISINQIGHVMGISTIAEFVEDEATRYALDSIGIDYVQGYGIATPLPLEAHADEAVLD